jgi:hypothetical protein
LYGREYLLKLPEHDLLFPNPSLKGTMLGLALARGLLKKYLAAGKKVRSFEIRLKAGLKTCC